MWSKIKKWLLKVQKMWQKQISAISIKFEIVVCKVFQFTVLENLKFVVWERINPLTHNTKFKWPNIKMLSSNTLNLEI